MIIKNIEVIYRADQGPVSRTQWGWPPQGATCRDADRMFKIIIQDINTDETIESVECAGKRIDMHGIVK